jgi:hypothetical protein
MANANIGFILSFPKQTVRGSAHPQNPYKPKQMQAGGRNERLDQKLYMNPASR